MKAEEFAARAPSEVLNQPPPIENYNLYECDRPLREAVAREGGGWVDEQAREFGALLGRAETLRLGELANRHPPVLHTHDRFGNRIDEVEFHPAWHELMRLGISYGTHSLPWISETSGAHAARATLMMLSHQVDEGHSCPITMTFAVVPSLRIQPELAAEWEPRVLSNEYDRRFVPAPEKRGALFGMAMTERQGGSDVRSNTTRAVAVSKRGPGEVYQITGHKWFCSAPMSDAFLVLAQAEGGLSCLLLPRWKPDGSRNAFHIQRLKDQARQPIKRFERSRISRRHRVVDWRGRTRRREYHRDGAPHATGLYFRLSRDHATCRRGSAPSRTASLCLRRPAHQSAPHEKRFGGFVP